MNMPVVVIVCVGFAYVIYFCLCIWWSYSFVSKRLFHKHPQLRRYLYQGLKPDWSLARIDPQDLFIYWKFQTQFAICQFVLAVVPMAIVILAVAAL